MAKETAELADYAASCRYEDIPPDVVERAKQCITDTIAAVIFGSAAMPLWLNSSREQSSISAPATVTSTLAPCFPPGGKTLVS